MQFTKVITTFFLLTFYFSNAEACSSKIFTDQACAQKINVKNMNELTAYLDSVAQDESLAKRLRIRFDIDTNSNLLIENPCKVSIQKNRNVSVQGNLCIHTPKDIVVNKNVIFNVTGDLGFKSGDNVIIKDNSTIASKNLSLEAVNKAVIRKGADINVTENISLLSTGNNENSRVHIRKNSTINAMSLSLSAHSRATLGANSTYNISENIKVETTGEDAKFTAIWKDTTINTKVIELTSPTKIRIGKGNQITADQAILNSDDCNINVLEGSNIGSQSGSCVGNTLEAQFSFTPSSGVAPLEVVFDASTSIATSPIRDYIWEIEGNTFQRTNSNFSYTFTSPGDFEIKLTLVDITGASSEITNTVTVLPVDSAITPNLVITKELHGLPTKFKIDASQTGSSVEIDRYFFTFSDGSVQESENGIVEHFFAEEGTHSVKVEVFDKNEFSVSITDTLTVVANQLPVADFTYELKSVDPYLVRFDASGSNDDDGIVQYLWNLGDGNSIVTTEPVLNYTYQNAGDYEVSLILIDSSGEKDDISVEIEVNPFLIPKFEISAANGFSAPSIVSFDASTTIGLKEVESGDTEVLLYTWNFGNGSPIQETYIPFTANQYNVPGTYIVSLTVEDGINDPVTITKQVVIQLNTPPVASFASTKLSGIAPLSVSFDPSTTIDNEGPLNYSWGFGTGNTASNNNGEVVVEEFSNPGTYIVSLDVEDNRGETSSTSITITVNENQAPVPSFDLVANAIAPTQILLDASNSTDEENIVEYKWTLSDGRVFTSSGPLQNISFNTPEDVAVTLEVKDPRGLTASLTKNVLVTAPSVAYFFTDKDRGVAPQSIIFDASKSSGGLNLTNYSFDLGNGDVVDLASGLLTYEFTTPGSYTVTLTTTDDQGGQESYSKDIEILDNIPPVAFFAFSQNSSTLELQMDASNSTDDEGIVEYLFDFGDGSTVTTTNSIISHQYGTSGNYPISVTVTDRQGISSKKLEYISYRATNTAPLGSFTASILRGNAPLMVQFSATGTDNVNISSYTWVLGDEGKVTTRLPNLKYTFQTSGEKLVRLELKDSEGLVYTTTQLVTVNEAPSASFTQNVVTGNPPLTVNFTSTSIDDNNSKSFAWSFGDNSSSTDESPVHVYSLGGTYNAKLIVTDDLGLTSESNVEIRVNTAPVVGITASKVSGDFPLNVNFTSSVSRDDSAIASYKWEVDGVEVSTDETLDYTFNDPGTFQVKLTLTDDQGLSSSEILPISVNNNPPPVANITVDKSSGVFPHGVNFDATGSTDNRTITSYSWNFKDGQSSAGSSVYHEFQNAGIYDVELTLVDDQGGEAVEIVQISVLDNTPPVAEFSLSSTNGPVPLTVYFDGSNSQDDEEVVEYSWNFGTGDTVISANDNTAYTFKSIGTYNITLTVKDIKGEVHTKQAQVFVNAPGTLPDNEGPSVEFSPMGGIVNDLKEPLSIALNDDSLVNYEKMRLTLNGASVPTANYGIDSLNNIISINLDDSFKLSESQLNILSISIPDEFNNITQAAQAYEVDLNPEVDTQGPLINFMIAKDEIDSLKPETSIFVFDDSGIDLNNVDIQLNGVSILVNKLTRNQMDHSIKVEFDDTFKLQDNFKNIITVIAQDNLGNSKTTEIGIDTEMQELDDPGFADVGSIRQRGNSCLLLDDDRVYCWGRGYIDFGEPVKKVINGLSASCAILESGPAKCWGANNFQGYLGLGTTAAMNGTVDANNNIDLSSVPFLNTTVNIVDINFGAFHTCALFENNKAKCWGWNNNGQLGQGAGTTYGDNETVEDIPFLDFGTDVSRIESGFWHTCAILVDGKVKCFGGNAEGQLGHGDTTAKGLSGLASVPFTALATATASDIYVGDYSNCAKLSTNQLQCWGRNNAGQLGNLSKDKIGDDEPVAGAHVINFTGDISKVAFGDSHACGIVSDKGVICWGANGNSQLGYRNFFPNNPAASGNILGDDEEVNTQSGVDLGGHTPVNIDVANISSCATLANGELVCWGTTVTDSILGITGQQIGDNEDVYPNGLYSTQWKAKVVTTGPSIAASFTASPEEGTSPLQVMFDASASTAQNGNITSYTWTIAESSFTENDPNFTYTFLSDGAFLVNLLIQTDQGESASYSRFINVVESNIAPIATLAVTKSFSRVGETLTFDASSSFDVDGDIVEYTFNLGNGETVTTTSSSIDYTFAGFGNYPVIVTVTDNYGDTSSSFPVVLSIIEENEEPNIAFDCSVTNELELSCDASDSFDYDGNITGHEWSLGDGSSQVGETIVYSYSAPSNGLYDVTLKIIDNGGLEKTLTKSFNVDTEKPAISTDLNEDRSVATSSFALNVQISDNSKTTTKIFLNNSVVLETENQSLSANLSLSEGSNSVVLESTDASGNVETQTLSLLNLDTTAPSLAVTSPMANSLLLNTQILFNGSSNEKLSELYINGEEVTLAEDQQTFSYMYTSSEQGEIELTVNATDLVGNETEQVIPVKVKVPVLTESLITFESSLDGTELKVIGAPNASRLGSHEVLIDGGFFNEETITTNADGSFEVTLKPSNLVKFTTFHPEANEDEVTSINYNADTTLMGVVKDTTGNPLQGVTVSIATSNQSDVTNANGEFSIISPATGDQQVVIDGTTIPAALSTDLNKKYSKTIIKKSISSITRNVVTRPIFLAPLMTDGSETKIIDNGAALVTSVHAPGVELDIPEGITNFPDGTNAGDINISITNKNFTTTEVPKFAEPESVITLEPSGLEFEEPVKLTLPNVNEFPEGMDVIIMSKNSVKGIWEIDGVGTVDQGGQTITTKDGFGVTHFSDVYASPIGPTISNINKGDQRGTSITDGAVTKLVNLPLYKTFGDNISLGLTYNSSWADPRAIVTNIIDIPRDERSFTYTQKKKKLLSSVKVTTRVDTWVEPEKIVAQFFTKDLVGEKLTFTGVPNKSVVSYGLDFSDQESGVYPYLSQYEIHLKQMVLRTSSGSSKFLGIGSDFSLDPEASVAQRQVFNDDLLGQLYVQNKKNSEFGRGWKANFGEKIINSNDIKVYIEEANGSIHPYALDNKITTLYQDEKGISAVDFSHYPELTFVTKDGNIRSVDISDNSSVELVPSEIARTHQYPGTYKERYHWKTFKIISKRPSIKIGRLHCGNTNKTYSLLPKTNSLVVSDSGEIFTTDGYSSIQKVSGDISTVEYGQLSTLKSRAETPGGILGTNWAPTNTLRNLFGSNSSIGESSRGEVACGVDFKIGSSLIPISGFRDGVRIDAHFNNPYGMSFSPTTGEMVVADYGNNRIRAIDIETGISRTIAGNGQVLDSGDGGSSQEAAINHPRGVAHDSHGNLYITTESGAVRRIDTNGVIVTIAGKNNGTIDFSGNSLEMKLNKPTGMVFDNDSNFLYVADSGNNRIVRLKLEEGLYETVAGNFSCSELSVDGDSSVEASLCNPKYIGLDDNNNLLIHDEGHSSIRRVTFDNSVEGKLSYVSTSHDNSTLLKLQDGTYERRFRNGNKSFYDSDGRQTSFLDRIGNEMSFSYNSEGLISKQTDFAGSEINFEYLANKLSRIVDPAGRETSFEYIGDDLSKINFPDGTSRSFTYSDRGLLVEEFDRLGHKKTHYYDQWNRLTKTVREDSSEINFSSSDSQSVASSDQDNELMPYGEEGFLDRITDPRGIETTLRKDQNGFVDKVTDGAGQVTEFERDSKGRLTKVKRPDASEFRMAYDEVTGDVLSQEDTFDGSKKIFTYDNYGNILTTEDSSGNIERKFYDDETGLLVKSSNNQGNSLLYEHNSRGQDVKITNEKGDFLTQEFDTFGNLSVLTDHEGSKTYYSRSPAGYVIEEENALGQVIKREFDKFNRMTMYQSANSLKTFFEFDNEGEVTKIQDQSGKAYSFTLNEVGLVTKVTNPIGFETLYEYDLSGNKTKETDPNGNEIFIEYDNLNRIVKEVYPDDLYEYDYDSRGNRISLKNKVGKIDLSFEQRNFLHVIAMEAFTPNESYNFLPAYVNQFSHDTNGNITKAVTSHGDFSYNFDSLNRLISMSNHKGESFSFDYDELSRLIRLERPGSSSDYSYNKSNFLKLIQHEKNLGGSTIDFFEYSNDAIGNNRQIRTKFDNSEFNFNLDNQLVSSSIENVESNVFNYDVRGNRSSDSAGAYVYDSESERLIEDAKYTYLYDPNGNMTTRREKSPGTEELILTYSVRNQLIKLEKFESGSLAETTEYLYGPQGNRLEKKHINHILSDKNTTRRYTYLRQNNLSQLDENNDSLAIYTFSPLRIDDALSVEITTRGQEDSLASEEGSFFYIKDGQGSIKSIVNDEGDIKQFYSYSSFGKLEKILDGSRNDISSTPFIEPFLTYTGRILDKESGIYYYRARYYDSNTGRFLQEDPFKGDMTLPLSITNKYIYTLNNPLKYTDPSGESRYFGGPGDHESVIFNSNTYCGSERRAATPYDEGINVPNYGTGVNQPSNYSDLRCVKHDLELQEARDYQARTGGIKGYGHKLYHLYATDMEFYYDKVYNPNSWRRNGKFHLGQFLRSQVEGWVMLFVAPVRVFFEAFSF